MPVVQEHAGLVGAHSGNAVPAGDRTVLQARPPTMHAARCLQHTSHVLDVHHTARIARLTMLYAQQQFQSQVAAHNTHWTVMMSYASFCRLRPISGEYPPARMAQCQQSNCPDIDNTGTNFVPQPTHWAMTTVASHTMERSLQQWSVMFWLSCCTGVLQGIWQRPGNVTVHKKLTECRIGPIWLTANIASGKACTAKPSMEFSHGASYQLSPLC